MTSEPTIPETVCHAVAGYRPARDLKPHPANREIYGDEPVDQDLVESIRKHGLKEALVVTEDGTIISGHRRWRAVMAIDPDADVWCEVHPTFADDLEELEALLEYNRQREKNFSQKMAEAARLERIEAERAKRRQGARVDRNIPENLPEGSEFGETRDKVARKTRLGSGRTYSKAKTVVEAAAAGDETAKEMVGKLDAGEVSVDRAYREVTGKADEKPAAGHQIRVWFSGPDTAGDTDYNIFGGEMPDVGEQALAWIRRWQACGSDYKITRIRYNKTDIDIETLEMMVWKAGGDWVLPAVKKPAPSPEPAPAPTFEAPAVVIPPEVLALSQDEPVTIGVWYQKEGMPKPEYTNNRGRLAEGVISMTAWMRHTEVDPGYVFSKFKVGPHEVSREILEALRPWGRMEEEKEHTVSVYYTVAGVPLVRFFDGVPTGAAREALEWLRSPEAFEAAVRRLHYSDGAGSDMDISREGLARLAMPAPAKRVRPTSELERLYLERVRDEIESMLTFDKYPFESVLVAIDRVEVTVPPVERLPGWIRESLQQEGGAECQ
ncbi:hypothetical protein DSECCO2_213100 [anaerobic digester metagenome]